MRVVTLLDNNSLNEELRSAHGLSLYIEHNNKKILFDIGPANEYLKNAEQLNIDISDIDCLIISHGHRDHAGKLKKFLKVNSKAKVYIAESAFEKYYKVRRNIYIPIGLKEPKKQDRFVFIDKDTKIEEGIHIFKDVKPVEQIINDEGLLRKDSEDMYVVDKFDHEIYLLLSSKDKNVLFTGCAHKGIEHIIDSIEEKGVQITDVIGGFHFSQYDSSDLRQYMYLESFGKKIFNRNNTTCYTCHCVGDEAYLDLKQYMKDKLVRIKTGSEIKL